MTLAALIPTPADADAPLSALLKDGTRAEHSAAETTGFIEALMAGQLDRAAYADLAAQQLTIYTALEDVAERVATTPAGSQIVFAELTRVPSIEADLTSLYGADWSEQITVLPETARYAERIRSSADSLPRFAAHAYTRYLGDLSGGQILHRMLDRHYGLAGAGLSFYEFPLIPKIKPFKDAYRARLDALPLDAAGRALAVEEAQAAFVHNREMFGALGAVHLR